MADRSCEAGAAEPAQSHRERSSGTYETRIGEAGAAEAAQSHIVLIGMMGTGKSTVGRLVAGELGWRFLDSDEQVETSTGRTVRQIFEADGEAAYRRLESAALAAALADDEPAVVAAAGGVVLDAANRALLAGEELVVWLRAPPEVLAERVGRSDHRPLLADDPLGTLRRLATEREALYREVADVEIDVGARAPQAVADRVVALVRSPGPPAQPPRAPSAPWPAARRP